MSVNPPEPSVSSLAQVPPDVGVPLLEASAEQRIFERFLALAASQPQSIALVDASGSLSYAELEARSRQVALAVLAAANSPEDVVAIYGKRGAGLVVAMLGCLRAGRRFAVLDSGYPATRLRLLAELVGPRCLLLSHEPEAQDSLAQLLSHCPRLSVPELTRAAPQAEAGHPELDRVPASRIAYFLFTSGTTGVPKCVQANHRPLVHFIEWYAGQFNATSDSRFSMLAGLAHDPIFRDVFVALSTGGSVHVPQHEWFLNPPQLVRWLSQAAVTHMHVTPQLARVICTGASEPLTSLRFIGCGGDALKAPLVSDLAKVAPNAAVANFYGATETPQAMTFHVCEPEIQDPIPVGAGIADVQLLILSDTGELCDLGVEGQVALRTHFLSAGYLNDASLTSQKFVQLKDPRAGSVPVYLTGDYGYYRPDGAAIVRGRVDDQVKIRGFRVELAEVARRIERIDWIASSIVTAETTPSAEKQLVAYLVAREGSPEATAKSADMDIRQLLASDLPPYMVPAHYVWLPQLPLLPNGKVDRQRLPRPGTFDALGSGDDEQPLTDLERKIAASWSAVLGVKYVGLERTFVELGGDSLSFIQASAALEKILGKLPEQWEQLSVRQLAQQTPVSRGMFTQVDTSVLLRALAITFLVASNYRILEISGTTAILFVISGMSFGRYHLRAALQTGSVSSLLGTALKIAVPTVLLTLLLQAAQWRQGFHWQPVALVANFFDPAAAIGPTFWFIYVLIQIQLVAALLLSLPSVRQAFRVQPFWTALGAAVIGTLLKFGLPLVPALNTDHLYNRVPQMHVALFLTGCALVFADSLKRKLLVYALATVLFMGALLQGGHFYWFPNVALALLLLRVHVPLPRWLSLGTYSVAAASLYLYLAQFPILSILVRLHIENGWLMIAGALAAGVAMSIVWERIYAFAAAKLRAGARANTVIGGLAEPAK